MQVYAAFLRSKKKDGKGWKPLKGNLERAQGGRQEDLTGSSRPKTPEEVCQQ